ncbi:MAG TPA: type II secretion system major pseudopilin GspG [Candidatus Acidoferrum sp.]|nr:type II secretion system major pseudopilin GspG [Candidatus Acidoferrum sp.]
MNFRRRRRDISVDSSNKILAAPSGRHFRAFLELTRAHLGGKKANEYRAMSKDMHNLIQLLLIVLILGTVAFIVWPRTGGLSAARFAAAKADIVTINSAISMFQHDCGRYPTTEEGLAPLVERPPAIPAVQWRGSYLHGPARDPWGRLYIYARPGFHNTNAYDVYSLGPDGKGGNEAIGNWTPQP